MFHLSPLLLLLSLVVVAVGVVVVVDVLLMCCWCVVDVLLVLLLLMCCWCVVDVLLMCCWCVVDVVVVVVVVVVVAVVVVVVDDVGFLKYFQLTNNIGPIPLIFTSWCEVQRRNLLENIVGARHPWNFEGLDRWPLFPRSQRVGAKHH